MAKTILITGATDGIGLLTANWLTQKGHTMLLHGRNPAKLEAAAAQLDGTPETYVADLASLDEAAALAAAVVAKHDRLDVLINNAGVFKTTAPVAPNGQDVRFVVNTLAPALLTQALLPIIPQGGRVLNLSSAAQAPVQPEVMTRARPGSDMDAYAQSKLALTIWTQEVAKSYPDGPAMIAVNPGSLLGSKMVKEAFGTAGNDLAIGADILCRLALDPEAAAHSGRYWDNDSGRYAAPHASAADPASVARVMASIASALPPR